MLGRATAAAEPLGTGTFVAAPALAVPAPLERRTEPQSEPPSEPRKLSLSDARRHSLADPRRTDMIFRRLTVSDLGSQESNPRRSILAGLYRRESLLDLRYTSSARLSQPLNRPPPRSTARLAVQLHARRALRKALREGFEATHDFLVDLGCEQSLWQAYFAATTQQWTTYVRQFAVRFEAAVAAFNDDPWRGLDDLLRLRALAPARPDDQVLTAPAGDAEFPSIGFQIAYFLLTTPSVRRSTIGQLLNGHGQAVNRLLETVTMHLADLLEFAGLDVGGGIRFFTSHFPIGGESQVIYRSMDAFAKAYVASRLREASRDLHGEVSLAALFGQTNVLGALESETPSSDAGVSKSAPRRTILRRLLGADGSPKTPQYSAFLGRRELPGKRRARLWFRRRRVKTTTRLYEDTNTPLKHAHSARTRALDDSLDTTSLGTATTTAIGTNTALGTHNTITFGTNTTATTTLGTNTTATTTFGTNTAATTTFGTNTAATTTATTPTAFGTATTTFGDATTTNARGRGYLRCKMGSIDLHEEDLHLFQDATLAIGYAMIMLNTSQHHAALARKAKISKGTFRQMIGSVDLKVQPDLIDQWFGSFSAYPLKERESNLVEFYTTFPRQSSWLWPNRSTKECRTPTSEAMATEADDPLTTLIRMTGPKRQHVRYLWVDQRAKSLVWCGVFSSVLNQTEPADADLDMRRSTSRLKHRVTTRFRQVSKDHSPTLERQESAEVEINLTPRHTRVRTCSNTEQFPRRVDHQRFPTAPPTATPDLKSLPLKDLRGFAIVPLSRIRNLMSDVADPTKLLESSKVFNAVLKDGNSKGSLLQVITGPSAKQTVEFILPDTMTAQEIQRWQEFLTNVVDENLCSYESSLFTPPIQRPYRLVAQLPSTDSWDWAARLLFARDAKSRTKAWGLIHQHLREVDPLAGPDSWRVLDWLATIISAIPDLVIPDALREKQLETNLMRDVYASRLRSKESSVTLLEQLALEALRKFPLLLFPAQALGDASVRTQHWIVHHLTFGQTDVNLSDSETREVVHGFTPVACRLVDLGLEVTAVQNAMRRRSTVVRSGSPVAAELTYSPGVRWAVQGFSSVHICVRLMAALIKRSLLRVPRLAHFYLLGWLSQLLPLHRSSGLIVAAGFLTLLELRTDLMDFAGDDGFPAITLDMELRIPLHTRHWREIGFDFEGWIRDWYASAFITVIPLQGLAQCWAKLFAPMPVGQSVSVGGDNRAFVDLAIQLVQVLTLYDSALLLNQQRTTALFESPLEPQLWDLYLAS